MLRKQFPKRPDFDKTHEKMGFQYHSTLSTDGNPYWTEGIAYEFTLAEVEKIETATEELHSMCIDTVGNIIDSGDYPAEFGLSNESKSLIEYSWYNSEPHIYGRFDLCVIPDGSIKLFEYNADTPTSLLEAGVAQWQWLEETEGVNDQFNSIHDKLIERWKVIKGSQKDPTLYLFASRNGNYEDWGNLEYMADVAVQAGWRANIDEVEMCGYNSETKEFVDFGNNIILHAFKLYPWEWMMEEEFGRHVINANASWYEPAWKMLLSNKAILPVLWEHYKGHPNLLPAFFSPQSNFIKKPILGREGANIFLSDELVGGASMVPEYHTTYIYQEYYPLPYFNGFHPVVGSWVIGNEPAGIGIREDITLVTGNGSHFVPHYFND